LPPRLERVALSLAERATGCQALSARRRTGGESSEVYEVALDSGSVVIVRLHADPAIYATTRRNIETLAALDLPVPAVLFEAKGALVLEKIPGTDLRFVLPSLTDSQIEAIAHRIAGYQRTVMERLPPGHGYGWAGIGETGPHPTWKDAIGLKYQRDPRLLAAAEPLDDYLSNVPPTCHLDDITGKNVLIENGALTGLVDFDVVCYGDPHFWLGLTGAGILTDCGARELRYVDALIDAFGVDALGRRAIAFYSACIATEFQSRFAGAEDAAWYARMEAGIERWLGEISGYTDSHA
jgi:aminoglycoside phosphotransferase (APT) family kinase protein